MTTYNTGNPLGSSDPRDLYDNAENLDEAVNSDGDTFQDRLGKSRLTWAGMENRFESDQIEREVQFDADQSSREQEFRTFIASSGYQFAGDYAAGIEITQYNQIIRDENGEFWRVSGQVDLPYITTGVGVPEDDALVPVGDAVLRQDLANPDKGALMVHGAAIYVNTITDLQALPTNELVDGLQVSVRGGAFRWVAAQSYFAPSSFVTPEMFGAAGDGLTDDSTALSEALNFASTEGCEFKGAPGGVYRISSSVQVEREGRPPMTINWMGSTLYCDQAGLYFTGADNYLTTSMAADAARGDSKIAITDVTGVEKGDQLAIISPAISTGNVGTHHYYVVSKVDGNDVFIDGTVVNDIKESHIAGTGETGTIQVYFRKLSQPLEMRNGKVLVNDPEGVLTAITIRHQYRTLVDNMEFQGQTRNQLYIQYGGYDIVRDCFFRDYGYIEGDTGYSSLPEHPNGLGYGYGVIHARNYMSRVVGCIGGKGWHLTDASRGQMHITYESCTSQRNGFGFSTHENAWNLEYINCKALGQQGFTLARGHRVRMKGCYVGDKMASNGLVLGGTVSEAHIENCTFEMRLPPGNPASAIYQGSNGSGIRPSTLSDGYDPVYRMSGCKVIGRCRMTFGLSQPQNTITEVYNCHFSDGAYIINMHSTKKAIIENNFFEVITEGFAIDSNFYESEYVSISKNSLVHDGPPTRSFIQWKGNPTHSVISQNQLLKGGDVYLVRFLGGEGGENIGSIINNSGFNTIALGNETRSVSLVAFNSVSTGVSQGSVVIGEQVANIINGAFAP